MSKSHLAQCDIVPAVLNSHYPKSQVKSSHIYLYSAFHNTDCIKAASQ